MTARALLVPLLVAALGGCGLLGVGRQEFGFRTYPLRGLPYEDTVPLVLESTRRYMVARFDNVEIAWDPETRNVKVAPVFSSEGRRRMTLYMTVRRPEDGDGADVDMFALVQTLGDPTEGDGGWVDPKMDLPLENALSEAMVEMVLAEIDRRSGGS